MSEGKHLEAAVTVLLAVWIVTYGKGIGMALLLPPPTTTEGKRQRPPPLPLPGLQAGRWRMRNAFGLGCPTSARPSFSLRT